MRTPRKIIGDDAITQLAFEGYKVVRLERCVCGEDIEDASDVCVACGRHEDYGPRQDGEPLKQTS